jgi:hypothetical protein
LRKGSRECLSYSLGFSEIHRFSNPLPPMNPAFLSISPCDRMTPRFFRR